MKKMRTNRIGGGQRKNKHGGDRKWKEAGYMDISREWNDPNEACYRLKIGDDVYRLTREEMEELRDRAAYLLDVAD